MTQPAEAFLTQAQSCENLGSDFTALLLRLLAKNLGDDHPVGAALYSWTDFDTFRSGAVALRLAGALHSIVLLELDPKLSAAYPPNSVDSETLWNAVDQALRNHHRQILGWIESSPQTNEIRRSCALIPGFHLIAKETRLPLILSEIGASSGLNLNWDSYAMEVNSQTWGPQEATVRLTPEWRGATPPLVDITVAGREGCDVSPLDPAKPEDQLRMMSYIWPDQPKRILNTQRALDLAAKSGRKVTKQDAISFLARRLQPVQGATHVIYHSIMWQYLSDEDQAKGEMMIAEAGATATANAPLAWLRAEPDATRGSAAITLNIWPCGKARDLGRREFHGRWIQWNES